MSSPTIELVQFRLRPGVEPDTFLAAAADTQAALARLPGFLGRELLHDGEGLWVDVVRWRSRAEALSAAAKFVTMPEVEAFALMMEQDGMAMLHLERALA